MIRVIGNYFMREAEISLNETYMFIGRSKMLRMYAASMTSAARYVATYAAIAEMTPSMTYLISLS